MDLTLAQLPSSCDKLYHHFQIKSELQTVGEGGKGGGDVLLRSEGADLLCFPSGDHRISAAKKKNKIIIDLSAPLRAVRAAGRSPNGRIWGRLLRSVSLLRLLTRLYDKKGEAETREDLGSFPFVIAHQAPDCSLGGRALFSIGAWETVNLRAQLNVI